MKGKKLLLCKPFLYKSINEKKPENNDTFIIIIRNVIGDLASVLKLRNTSIYSNLTTRTSVCRRHYHNSLIKEGCEQPLQDHSICNICYLQENKQTNKNLWRLLLEVSLETQASIRKLHAKEHKRILKTQINHFHKEEMCSLQALVHIDDIGQPWLSCHLVAVIIGC